MSVAAAILAGGQARRLGGAPKALLDVGGRRIIDRQVDVLAPLVDEILLVVPGGAPFEDVAGVRLVADGRPGEGPLAGLETALAASQADAILLLGCDLPFLSSALVRGIRDHAPGAQAVVPRIAGRPQPLHARFARRALPLVTARLDRGARRLLSVLDALEVVFIDEPALRALDPAALVALTNVNTPEQLARAQELAQAARRQATLQDQV